MVFPPRVPLSQGLETWGSASDPRAASKLLLYSTTRNSFLLVTSLLLAPYPAGRMGGRDRNGGGVVRGPGPVDEHLGLVRT